MAMLGTRHCSLPSRQRLEVVAANRVRSKRQVAVSRTLIAKKGHEVQVATVAGEMMKFTEDECQVAGKGIVAFDCVRDGWEANTFHFWERYEDAAAFGAHSTSPRMMTYMEKLQPHLEGPIGISLYSYEDGRLGPVSMQAGPKGEGGLDDATGASGAAGGASYKQTSRAFDLTKVDEHEEASRDEKLLKAMGGPAVQVEVAAQPAVAKAEVKAEVKAKARSPLPSVQDLVGLAVSVKNTVMASVCKMLGH